MQQVFPVPRSIRNLLDAGTNPIKNNLNVVSWPLLFRRTPRLALEVEPNESGELVQEFFIPAYVQTIKLYTYFENALKSKPGKSIGWSKTTIYSIREEGGPAK